MVGSGWGSPVYWAVDIAVDNFVDNRGAGTRIFRFGVSTAGGSLHPIFWVPAKSIVMFHVKPESDNEEKVCTAPIGLIWMILGASQVQ